MTMEKPNKKIVSVGNVYKSFRNANVLTGVNLEIKKEKFFASWVQTVRGKPH